MAPKQESQKQGKTVVVPRTASCPHVRDSITERRITALLIVALLPCWIIGCYNVGYQSHVALQAGYEPLADAASRTYHWYGLQNSAHWAAYLFRGFLHWLPRQLVVLAVAGAIATARRVLGRGQVPSRLWVACALLPLLLPPVVPLGPLALATAFAALFSATPELVALGFLFFLFPDPTTVQAPWLPVSGQGASALTLPLVANLPLADGDAWRAAFIGLVPGSFGATSALASGLGCLFLAWTRAVSLRPALGFAAGTAAATALVGTLGAHGNHAVATPAYWHAVVGGWAFGAVFLATNPRASGYSQTAKLGYGLGAGVLVVLLRVLNPGRPEAVPLALLLMNQVAPLLDRVVVSFNVRRRAARRTSSVGAAQTSRAPFARTVSSG
jgi:Na+-transporting NADH:ubiquinone oxidoreductase subunit B